MGGKSVKSPQMCICNTIPALMIADLMNGPKKYFISENARPMTSLNFRFLSFPIVTRSVTFFCNWFEILKQTYGKQQLSCQRNWTKWWIRRRCQTNGTTVPHAVSFWVSEIRNWTIVELWKIFCKTYWTFLLIVRCVSTSKGNVR